MSQADRAFWLGALLSASHDLESIAGVFRAAARALEFRGEVVESERYLKCAAALLGVRDQLLHRSSELEEL